jgi:twinkle protein
VTESNLVSKGPCEDCGSSDACATYDDGHTHCFSCDAHHGGDGGAEEVSPRSDGAGRKTAGLIPTARLSYGPLNKRHITEETCRRYGYATSSTERLGPVHVALYRDADGAVCAHKLRTRDKDFTWFGDAKHSVLFGSHLCRSAGRRIIITEGEIDCLTVAQVLGNKWEVVSLPNGAAGAKRDVSKHLDWLNQFDEVILCFDMDDPGRDAVNKVAPLFPPGKAKVVSLPRKDPNEMLCNGEQAELVAALWSARTWRPDGIKTLAEIREEVMKDPEQGLPWWSPRLTAWTYGRRWGEAVALGAGTGIGKTDFITQQIAFDITVLNQKVGLFFLEQQPAETGKRVAGKLAKRRFHIPDGGWQRDELSAALDALDANKGLFFYDHFGSCEWERIRDTIRVMYHTEGVRIFYLDHLTALAAAEDDERKALERIMAELGGLVKEIPIWMLFVSHLATPEGKSHEEGGRVMAKHFKGSRAIQYWAHFMIGLERNNQADDEEERRTTTLRILKDRYTGRSTGNTGAYGYDAETGLLFEADGPEDREPSATDAEEDAPF